MCGRCSLGCVSLVNCPAGVCDGGLHGILGMVLVGSGWLFGSSRCLIRRLYAPCRTMAFAWLRAGQSLDVGGVVTGAVVAERRTPVLFFSEGGDVRATVFAEMDLVPEGADFRPVSNAQACVTQGCTRTVGAAAVFGSVVEDVERNVRALESDKH